MTSRCFSARAAETDQRSDGGSLSFPLLGLFGEIGSLLSEVKKKQRDRASYLGYAGAVVEELGDVLWYLSTVAARGGIALNDIFAEATPGPHLQARNKGEALSFAAVQPAVLAPTTTTSTSKSGRPLLIATGGARCARRGAAARPCPSPSGYTAPGRAPAGPRAR